MKKLFVVLLCLGLAGCATVPNLNSISLGMTKPDVIKNLGNPDSVSAKDNIEYLKYSSAGALTPPDLVQHYPEYYVRLIDGKVESYGKVGDFDSTKDQVNVIKLQGEK